MRIISLCLFLITFCSPAFAQTQAEMTQQACGDFQKADKALNVYYAQLKNTCKNDAAFLKRLKSARQTWIKLRDVQTDLLYPMGPAVGTMQPLLRCTNMTDMTQKRTVEFKKWNKDAREVYLCDGVKR